MVKSTGKPPLTGVGQIFQVVPENRTGSREGHPKQCETLNASSSVPLRRHSQRGPSTSHPVRTSQKWTRREGGAQKPRARRTVTGQGQAGLPCLSGGQNEPTQEGRREPRAAAGGCRPRTSPFRVSHLSSPMRQCVEVESAEPKPQEIGEKRKPFRKWPQLLETQKQGDQATKHHDGLSMEHPRERAQGTEIPKPGVSLCRMGKGLKQAQGQVLHSQGLSGSRRQRQLCAGASSPSGSAQLHTDSGNAPTADFSQWSLAQRSRT